MKIPIISTPMIENICHQSFQQNEFFVQLKHCEPTACKYLNYFEFFTLKTISKLKASRIF